MKNRAGWSTCWNQDFREKYQQPQICRWHHRYGRKRRGTKEPLDESEREECKSWLKLNIQKTKVMVSSPITSWQIGGETVADFIFLGSRITADGDCSHEIKRHLLLGRKAMTNLDSRVKSRDIILPTKVCLVKDLAFPVVMYGCESWAIKKAECLKNWCFWTVVLEKTLESPLDCKEIKPVNTNGNQSWIFIGRTDAEAEASILWPPDAKNWLIWKDPYAGKDWRQDDRRWDGWMAWLTQCTWVLASSGRWWRTWKLGVLQFMGS